MTKSITYLNSTFDTTEMQYDSHFHVQAFKYKIFSNTYIWLTSTYDLCYQNSKSIQQKNSAMLSDFKPHTEPSLISNM